MEPTPPAHALVRTALDTLGVDAPPKHLTGRKGADTWRAGEWTIKTALPGARGHLGHETAAYELRHRQGLHPGVRHAAGEGGRWLALPWLEGRSLWEVFAPARGGAAVPEAQRAEMRAAAGAAFDALRELHRAGWLHGDMQAENALVLDGGRVEFIDYDLAQHDPGLSLPFPYRGGLVHVIAPELAARLLATGEDQHAELTRAAELFALGAALYWAWTGHRITDYRGDPAGPHPALYADIAQGRRRDLHSDRPWPDPALEGLIDGATRSEPTARTHSG